MTVKISGWIFGVGMVVIALLLFGRVRSCKNTDNALQENQELKNINLKLYADSIEAYHREEDYKAASELQDGQITLKENQLQAKDDSLETANIRITKLLNRHIPITPNADTNITTVPNEYITDCEGCFTELYRGREMVISYKDSVGSLRKEYKEKIKTDSSHIADLNEQNFNLIGTIKDALKVARKAKEDAKPHWKILFSMSTMAINANVPNAAGIGFGYQDKYNRIVAAKYFTSEYGSIKQIDLFVPLSFKRKK